ncbi:MAG: hypothetical protein J0I84_21330 [Terrimonas sp.]|nr:hypothetical protein [Terrimonas sp.]OJY92688.1 MAG: hypothetical protein BGP13_19195 [Sphingobacteriales bacterium 40-81]
MSCTTKVKASKIVLTDGAGKTKMCFNNPNKRQITKIIVDNCAIKSGIRCDFMLVDHKSLEHYIELKGKQIIHACNQIEETIKQLTKNVFAVKHSFIVSTACPLTTTEVQILKAQFKKKYNSTLTVKNMLCEHCFE